MEITIPDLGDIEDVEVIEICVAVGDAVAENDVIIVIESDKASMEIPAPCAGSVEAIRVNLGDPIKQGDVIGVISTDVAVAAPEEEPVSPDAVAADSALTEADMEAESSAETEVSVSARAEMDVLVPDLGDAEDVVVTEVAVKPGDPIGGGDLLVVLESDKASMEIAAESPGRVLAVAVEEGQEVEQGTLIATLAVAALAEAPVKTVEAAAASPAADSEQPKPVTDTGADAEPDVRAAATVYAGPAVRRLARELGVQLENVEGSGNRNRITKDDVKTYVKSRMQGPETVSAGTVDGAWPQVPKVDHGKFGPVEYRELTRIQQRGADNLHRSWVNLPHVTQHDEADLTDLESFRASLKEEGERKGIKVTPLAFLIKACCNALREYPMFNSSLHEDGRQLVVKQYFNIGMAVDTPDGLVVPVIKEADVKSIWELSEEIARLSEKARTKKLAMDDLQGGTFTVSSLGPLGGTGFTPIVNAPEVAILGVAKLQTRPVWDGHAFQPREMLPLSLSYDHRVINGADGGRFMLHLTALLGDIRRLAL